MWREIKEAVKDFFKWYSECGNMLSTYKRNQHLVRVLANNNVHINVHERTITKNGIVVATYEERYAKRKKNGCYKMLLPKITWCYSD